MVVSSGAYSFVLLGILDQEREAELRITYERSDSVMPAYLQSEGGIDMKDSEGDE